MKSQVIMNNTIDSLASIRNKETPITVVAALVHPPRAHKTRWTKAELNLLLELITSGYPLDIIQPFFSLRSNGAVIKQAQRCGFKRKTDVHGNIIFEKGIESRNRKKRTSAIGVAKVIDIEQNSEKVSDVIVAENEPAKKKMLLHAKIDPNRKAVNMLQRASLPFDPDVVCTLTKHIIANQENPT